MTNTDQGAVMKKILLTLLLAAGQCGCVTPPTTQADGPALISYTDIAAEIKISYQDESDPIEPPQPVAAN